MWGVEKGTHSSPTVVDTTSVWLTPEIVHFAVSKYLSHSSTYLSSPEHLCSPALTCGLPRSPALCHTHPCSAVLTCALPHSPALCCAHLHSAMLTHALLCSLTLCRTHPCSAMLTCTLLCSPVLCCAHPRSATRLWAAFPRFAPCPLASPVHLVPLSFLVTTYTLVPGPLGHLVYKPCNYTLLPKKRNPVAFSPFVSDLSELSVALTLYSRPCCTCTQP
jgi:hypothetical protein